jgi:phosphoglycolate phosphatase-like HAD superfamily hydrolase
MRSKSKIEAVLWDYDGTLVNSAPKNIAITKEILARVAPRLTGDHLPECLRNEESYHIVNHKSKNWQDLYMNYYGLTPTETQAAGPLWTEYQLNNNTPVNLFEGIVNVIENIKVPQGICSQNSSDNILNVLSENKLVQCIQEIVGYDDIPESEQKPSPYSGILCLNKIFDELKNKTIAYIGDHEADVEFARNISDKLDSNSKVIAITVTYSGADPDAWNFKPDYSVSAPEKLLEIVNLQID